MIELRDRGRRRELVLETYSRVEEESFVREYQKKGYKLSDRYEYDDGDRILRGTVLEKKIGQILDTNVDAGR
jgi:hypothetical protein